MAEDSIPADLPKSRALAKKIGAKWYFTGKPCSRGHVGKRSAASGQCNQCRREYDLLWQRDYRAKNHARILENARRWEKAYFSDPVNCARRLETQRSRSPKARSIKQQRRNERREALAGRPKPDSCEICDRAGEIHFDHCHTTGQFRGWICERCNVTLGFADDDPALLRKLADYLDRARAAAPDQIDLVRLLEVQRVLNY